MKLALGIVSLFFLKLLLSGCAGPMSPFGAINKIYKNNKNYASQGRPAPSQVNIKFHPKRIVFHKDSPIEIDILDKKSIPLDAKVRVYHNDLDVTEHFEVKSHRGAHLVLKSKNLRLLAKRDNKIRVEYQRENHSQKFVKSYKEPICPIDDQFNISPFGKLKKKRYLMSFIKKESQKHNFNPALITGLIAQESNFDPKAVSSMGAIGLTQVTSIAEKEISENFNNWPRYPELSELSPSWIKTLIFLGQINSKNEWRLNSKKSIEGGSFFLNKMKNYWTSKEENKTLKLQLKSQNPEALTDLILASYNSGPWRVKRSLKSRGDDWLNHPELSEAKNYIKKVKSYCYHNSNQGSFYEK